MSAPQASGTSAPDQAYEEYIHKRISDYARITWPYSPPGFCAGNILNMPRQGDPVGPHILVAYCLHPSIAWEDIKRVPALTYELWLEEEQMKEEERRSEEEKARRRARKKRREQRERKRERERRESGVRNKRHK